MSLSDTSYVIVLSESPKSESESVSVLIIFIFATSSLVNLCRFFGGVSLPVKPEIKTSCYCKKIFLCIMVEIICTIYIETTS